MNTIYKSIGISKQGFHQWANRMMLRYEEQQQLLPILRELRSDHPKMSCREFYYMLRPSSMGRDRFEAFCYDHGYKVELKRNKYKTTDSNGVKRFDNHLLTLDELTGVNQLWVSDITYFSIGNHVYYLTFILDIYNRKIVGHSTSDNLTTQSTTLRAFKMAARTTGLKSGSGLIFHSDGGGQYYCKDFIKLTKAYGVTNSMGKTVYENPHAERINGTIKNNYLIPYQPRNFNELKKMMEKAINLYNHQKPHKALGKLSPVAFTNQIQEGLLNKVWSINRKKKITQKEEVNIIIR